MVPEDAMTQQPAWHDNPKDVEWFPYLDSNEHL